MQPNSPNEGMNTLGNEETALNKKLVTLEGSPLQAPQKKEKRPENKIETPTMMSSEDLKEIYKRKKKMRAREPFGLQMSADSFVVASNGKFLVSYYNDPPLINVFDLEIKEYIHHFDTNGEEIDPYHQHDHYFKPNGTDKIIAIALTPDNRFVIYANKDYFIKIFDLETKEEFHQFKASNKHFKIPLHLTTTSDCRYIMMSSVKSSKLITTVFDLQNKQLLPRIYGSLLGTTSDNKLITSGGQDKSIKIIDMQTNQEVGHIKNEKRLKSARMTSDDRFLIAVSGDTIIVFDLQAQKELHSFENLHEKAINSFVITSNNRFIVSRSAQDIKVFRIATKQQVGHIQNPHQDSISSITVTSDDRFIISCSKKSIKVFDFETKQEVHHFQSQGKRFFSEITVTPDNKFIISRDEYFSIKIFDFEMEEQGSAHRARINAVAFTSDNKFVISNSEDNSLKVFDIQTKQQVYHFQNVHPGNTDSIALTSDNKFLISCGGSGYNDYFDPWGSRDGYEGSSLKVFDFETKQQVLHFEKYEGFVPSMTVTSDDKFVILKFKNGDVSMIPLESVEKDVDPENAMISVSSSPKGGSSLLIPDPKIFNRELNFVYPGMRKFTRSTTLDHFLFDKPLEYSISQAVRYSDIFVLPFRWTILHIVSVFANHDFIEKMPEYSQFKMPFLMDISHNTPLHYLIAHKNVNSITVNIMFRYTCDYLEDCYTKSPYEFQKIIESMTNLLPDIFQRIEIKSRLRFLRIVYAKSSLPHGNPAPTFGKILSEAANASDSPVLTQETRDKIWNDKGTTQVEFRSNFLHLDYDILSEDMGTMVDCLQNQEGEEIFNMPVIMRLIDHLWGQAETPLIIFFALYSAFIIALSVYLTFDDRSLAYEITLLVVSLLFTANEFMQISHLRMGYLEDLWNWLDLAHLFLTIAFLITRIADNDNELARAWISTIIIILGYIRWISLLKIFKPTRNLIQVVITIVKDMVSFIIIIALIIIAFSLIFLVFNREAGYGDYLYDAYNVMYGPMDIEEDATWPFSQKLIMAVLAFFLNVVLLNLLISIMGDSYGQVLEMRDRTDALTRLEMISEAVIYKKFFKPNHKAKRGSLVYCLPLKLEVNEENHNQELKKNIRAVESLIQQNNDDLKEKTLSSEKSNEAVKNEILDLKKNNETIKNEISSMKTEISTMKTEMSTMKNEISNLILSEFSKLRSGFHPTGDFSKKQTGISSNVALKKDFIDDTYPAHPEEN